MTLGVCKFCDLIAARGGQVVYDDDLCIAILDDRPLFPGHCLLLPREHVETLADLPVARVGPLFRCVQRLAAAVERAMGADGTFVAINNRFSQSITHLHVHIVPRRRKDGLRGFFWPRTRYASDEEMADVARQIREAVRSA